MADPATQKFLMVRLGSLGDLVHTLPAVAALRSSFPTATIDWVVQDKWAALLELVTGVDTVIPLGRSLAGQFSCVRRLREAAYSCAVDFQGLYKSSLLARFSGAQRRIGFDRTEAREPAAAWFYTERVPPHGRHIAEANLGLAVRAGAAYPESMEFPLRVPEEESELVNKALLGQGIHAEGDWVVISPGAGWKSKSWPADRYGALCGELWRRSGVHSVINTGPGEDALTAAVLQAAVPAKPVVLHPSLRELIALLAKARVVIAADTGPLHLAAALGTRVVALFGPTGPERNGPLPRGTVLRNVSYTGTTHGRSGDYSAAMLSLSVKQVADAVEEEMSVAA